MRRTASIHEVGLDPATAIRPELRAESAVQVPLDNRHPRTRLRRLDPPLDCKTVVGPHVERGGSRNIHLVVRAVEGHRLTHLAGGERGAGPPPTTTGRACAVARDPPLRRRREEAPPPPPPARGRAGAPPRAAVFCPGNAPPPPPKGPPSALLVG